MLQLDKLVNNPPPGGRGINFFPRLEEGKYPKTLGALGHELGNPHLPMNYKSTTLYIEVMRENLNTILSMLVVKPLYAIHKK